METVASNRRVRRIYERWAWMYDAFTAATEKKSLSRALALAGLKDGEAVLEIAVGTGFAFGEILRANPSGRNVGIDLTDAMLGRARKKALATGIAFELSIGDARSLAFEDGAFDMVWNANMLGLVPEESFAAILGEMFRVLRPGGRLVLVTMVRPKGAIANAFYQVVPIWFGGWRDIGIEPFVARAGFEVVAREVVTQLGVPSEILIAQKP